MLFAVRKTEGIMKENCFYFYRKTQYKTNWSQIETQK